MSLAMRCLIRSYYACPVRSHMNTKTLTHCHTHKRMHTKTHSQCQIHRGSTQNKSKNTSFNQWRVYFCPNRKWLCPLPESPLWPKEVLDPVVVSEGSPLVLACNPPPGLPPPLTFWMNSCESHTHTQDCFTILVRTDNILLLQIVSSLTPNPNLNP